MAPRNEGQFSDCKRGKHKLPSILDDEEAPRKAVKYVRENAYKKGEPNLTAGMFCM